MASVAGGGHQQADGDHRLGAKARGQPVAGQGADDDAAISGSSRIMKNPGAAGT